MHFSSSSSKQQQAASGPILFVGTPWLRVMIGVALNDCRAEAHNSRGKAFAAGETGTVIPLLTSAVSAPWRPSHAGAGDA